MTRSRSQRRGFPGAAPPNGSYAPPGISPARTVSGPHNTRPETIIRYTKGSRAIGVEAGEYAQVTNVDSDQNLLTVRRGDGEYITYDPRRLQGVNVYREAERILRRRPYPIHRPVQR